MKMFKGFKIRVMAALLIAILTVKVASDLWVGEPNITMTVIWAICCVSFPILSWVFYIFGGV